MAATRVSGRRPNNLDDAPELLNQVQAAAALGITIDAIGDLERDDPAFPKRQRVPFVARPVFLRGQLRRWVADLRAADTMAEAQ